ncbi:hypothetical protein Vretifemale_3511 [Volvox reticuliferus]|uniref:Bromo domain-containing protein n=4 Tax=Volvox reticuliferus TaxID=1737510 RepID=A0A8J4C107_9CHLO|nr:hypothetical protein Vretifemale_3511 [Volvox reticuliferus]
MEQSEPPPPPQPLPPARTAHFAGTSGGGVIREPVAVSRHEGSGTQAANAVDVEPLTWRPAALTILRTLLLEPFAREFSAPVDPEQNPGYLEVVGRPMDLSTVLGNLRKGAYASCIAVATDVALIASNCRRYNPPGSPILRRAEQLMAAFASAWRASGLPLPPGAGFPSDAALRDFEDGAAGVTDGTAAAPPLQRRPPRQGAGQNPRLGGRGNDDGDDDGLAGKTAQRPAVRKPAAAQDGGPVPQHESWQPLALSILRSLLSDPRASPFANPVDVNQLPGYTKIVSRPIDLGTIVRDLETGRYASLGPSVLLDDVRLVWSNCRRYNQPGSSIVADAEHCRSTFNRTWQRLAVPAGLPAATAGAAKLIAQQAASAAAQQERYEWPGTAVAAPPRRGGGGGAAAAARGVGGGGDARASAGDDWHTAADEALQRLMRNRVAALFLKPVDPAEAPGYLDVVTRPMDLSTVTSRLRQRAYADLNELLADVDQIWENCRTYNNKSSRVYKLGEQAATQWQTEMEAVGLVGGGGRQQRSRRRRRTTAAAAMYDSASDGGDSGGEGLDSDDDDERGGGGGGGRRSGGSGRAAAGYRASKRSRVGDFDYD